jgi:hypothetical protein
MGLQSLVLIRDTVAMTEVVGRELRFFGGGHEALLPAGALCPTLIRGLTLVIGRIPRIRSQPACAKQEERANLSLPRSPFGRASGALRFLFSQPGRPNLYRLFNREGRAKSFSPCCLGSYIVYGTLIVWPTRLPSCIFFLTTPTAIASSPACLGRSSQRTISTKLAVYIFASDRFPSYNGISTTHRAD